MNSTSNKLYNFTIISCLWFSAFSTFYTDSMNSIALYAVLPFAFVLSFWHNGFTIKTNKYANLLIWLYIWCLFACLWAYNMDIAFRQMKQILGAFLISYIFAVNAKNKSMLSWLYASYIIILASAWLYAQTNIQIDASSERFRLGDDKLNANMLAYFLFYTTVSVFVLGDIVKNKLLRSIYRNALWFVLPLTFMTALLTASRQVLLIQVPLLLLFLYIRYIKGAKGWRKYSFYFFIAVFAMISTPYVISEYSDSYLAERSSRSVQDDARTFLILDALKVGFEHFPIGVGPGNYAAISVHKHFSHNTFTELWANVGLVGLLIYCSMLFAFVNKQWYRFKTHRNINYIVFLIIAGIFILDNMIYVFYPDVWLMPFFILLATHGETFHKEVIYRLSYKS